MSGKWAAELCIICAMIVGLVLGGVSGRECGREVERRRMMDEAVKHRAAEYYLDANHQRAFRWIIKEN